MSQSLVQESTKLWKRLKTIKYASCDITNSESYASIAVNNVYNSDSEIEKIQELYKQVGKVYTRVALSRTQIKNENNNSTKNEIEDEQDQMQNNPDVDPLTNAKILYIETNNPAVGAKPRWPRSMQIACRNCTLTCYEQCIQCETCNSWFHFKCQKFRIISH